MALGNSSTKYGSLAKTLHWLAAIALIALVFLGLEQSDMESGDERSRIRFIHASIATTLLVLMTVRLVWRWVSQLPAHPEGMPAWQRISSSVVHWGLYLSVFVQLFAGAMVVGTGGRGLPFFGLFTIPLPVTEDHDAHEWWEGVHEYAWIPIAVLVGVHVLGALYNHFIVKNDVLRRMTFGLK